MTDKRKLLDLAFNGRDKNAIKSLIGGFDEAEMEAMSKTLKTNPETLSDKQLHSLHEYFCMKDGKPYIKIDFSNWTNQQLEAELFRIRNNQIDDEK